MPEERPEAYRSCVLRIGTYIVIQNVLKEHKLPGMLEKHLSQDYGTRRSDYYIEALDRKIERLQEKDKEYSVLAEELYTLLDERHPERKSRGQSRRCIRHTWKASVHWMKSLT